MKRKRMVCFLLLFHIIFGVVQGSILTASAAVSDIGIDLSTAKENKSGDGWVWDMKTKTLTITNLSIDTERGNGIKLPQGAVLQVKGTNIIRTKDGEGFGIYADGNLTIKGDGILVAEGAVGINCKKGMGVLTLYESVTVTARGNINSTKYKSLVAEDGMIMPSFGDKEVTIIMCGEIKNEDFDLTQETEDEETTSPEMFANCDGTGNCRSKDLKDIDPKEWYHKYVDFVIANGLMQGMSADSFDPLNTATRGMLVTIVYRMKGMPTISAKTPFSDVARGSYYEAAVSWAAQNQLVQGYGDGLFGPDDFITREQFVTVLMRYANHMNKDTSERGNLSVFADEMEINKDLYDAMSWAFAEGLVTGYDTGTVNPKGKITRVESAAILSRFTDWMKTASGKHTV